MGGDVLAAWGHPHLHALGRSHNRTNSRCVISQALLPSQQSGALARQRENSSGDHSLITHNADWPPQPSFYQRFFAWDYSDPSRSRRVCSGEGHQADKKQTALCREGSVILAPLGTRAPGGPLRQPVIAGWRCRLVWGLSGEQLSRDLRPAQLSSNRAPRERQKGVSAPRGLNRTSPGSTENELKYFCWAHACRHPSPQGTQTAHNCQRWRQDAAVHSTAAGTFSQQLCKPWISKVRERRRARRGHRGAKRLAKVTLMSPWRRMKQALDLLSLSPTFLPVANAL